MRAAPYCGWFYPNVANWSVWQKNKSAGISWDYIRGLNEIWSDDGEVSAPQSVQQICTLLHNDGSYHLGLWFKC